MSIDDQIALEARVVSDGHAGYSGKSLGERSHDAIVRTRAERRKNDVIQSCHWTVSLLKRWLLGTHAGAVRRKHLQAYLDEYGLPPQSPQDQRRGSHRGARHRAPGGAPAV